MLDIVPQYAEHGTVAVGHIFKLFERLVSRWSYLTQEEILALPDIAGIIVSQTSCAHDPATSEA